jgi:hypothetical protein
LHYMIQVEVDPNIGSELEGNPKDLHEWIGSWQSLDVKGMYFAITRRAVTIIVDAPNEDAFFEQLHASWVITGSYPEVWPVATADQFPAMMQRVSKA